MLKRGVCPKELNLASKWTERADYFIDHSDNGLLYHTALQDALKFVRSEKSNRIITSDSELALCYRELLHTMGDKRYEWYRSGGWKYHNCCCGAWFPKYKRKPFATARDFDKHLQMYRKQICGRHFSCPFCHVRYFVRRMAVRAWRVLSSRDDVVLALGHSTWRLTAKNLKDAYAETKDWARKMRQRGPGLKSLGQIYRISPRPVSQDVFKADYSFIVALPKDAKVFMPYRFAVSDYSAILGPQAKKRTVFQEVAKILPYPIELLETAAADVASWMQDKKAKRRVVTYVRGIFKRKDVKAMQPRKKFNRNILAKSINVLELDIRVVNALEDETTSPVIKTVGELLNCTPDDLRALPNIGEKTITGIIDALARVGIYNDTYKFPEPTVAEIEDAIVQKTMIGL